MFLFSSQIATGELFIVVTCPFTTLKWQFSKTERDLKSVVISSYSSSPFTAVCSGLPCTLRQGLWSEGVFCCIPEKVSAM